jgi:hypothetical protein
LRQQRRFDAPQAQARRQQGVVNAPMRIGTSSTGRKKLPGLGVSSANPEIECWLFNAFGLDVKRLRGKK